MLSAPAPDPVRKQRIEEKVLVFIAIENITRIERLDGLLHGRCRAEPEFVANRILLR
jgi:hypothetical protein